MVRQPNGSHEVLWHGAWPPKSCTHEPVGEYKRVGTTFSHLVAVHTAYHAGRVSVTLCFLGKLLLPPRGLPAAQVQTCLLHCAQFCCQ